MIIGIGSDLIDIRRIEKTLERFGDRFIERCVIRMTSVIKVTGAFYEPKVTLNVTRPKKLALKHWARVSGKVCFGATWV